MGEIALNKKPTAEDFEYAYVENSTGEIVRVPKEKILAIPEDKYVKITEQALTKEQQSQSRTNIGAASKEEVSQLSDEINDMKQNGTGGEPTVVGGFVAQDEEPTDTSLLWIDTNDESGDDENPYYTKTEIDEIMGSYVDDIASLVGGDA